jgi:hypothetical protein
MSDLHRSRPEGCLSDLSLDRMVVGERKRSAEQAAHLLACPHCRMRLDVLERDSRDFDHRLYLPARPKRSLWRWAGGGGLLVAAAAILMILVRPPADPKVRFKGGFQLELIARHADDGRVERLLPGAALSPDDAIRFRVASDRDVHLIVLGLDAAGQVTPYAPAVGAALALAATREKILDGSIVLDGTLGPERVVALACSEAMPVERAVGAAKKALERSGGDPRRVSDLGLGCQQATGLFVKVPRK